MHHAKERPIHSDTMQMSDLSSRLLAAQCRVPWHKAIPNAGRQMHAHSHVIVRRATTQLKSICRLCKDKKRKPVSARTCLSTSVLCCYMTKHLDCGAVCNAKAWLVHELNRQHMACKHWRGAFASQIQQTLRDRASVGDFCCIVVKQGKHNCRYTTNSVQFKIWQAVAVDFYGAQAHATHDAQVQEHELLILALLQLQWVISSGYRSLLAILFYPRHAEMQGEETGDNHFRSSPDKPHSCSRLTE